MLHFISNISFYRDNVSGVDKCFFFSIFLVGRAARPHIGGARSVPAPYLITPMHTNRFASAKMRTRIHLIGPIVSRHDCA